MRIYFEQRELLYIDVPEAEDFKEGLKIANDRMDNDDTFWQEVRDEGQMEHVWCSQEVTEMLQD